MYFANITDNKYWLYHYSVTRLHQNCNLSFMRNYSGLRLEADR